MTVEHSEVMSTGEYVFAVRAWDQATIIAEPWGPDQNPIVDMKSDLLAEGEFWIRTGNGFAYAQITTRLHDTAPGDPDVEWEDIVELSLTASTPVAVTDLVENDPAVPLIEKPGRYRVRVSVRGRLLEDDPENDLDEELDEEDPVEFYLLEAWPAAPTAPVVVRETSVFARHNDDDPSPLQVPETKDGLAAAARIGRDIDRAAGARPLSGATGATVVRRIVPGTRRRLFPVVAHATSFSGHVSLESSWTWSGAMSEEPGHEMYAFSGDHADQLTGRTGTVRYSFLDVDKPRRAVRRWNWLVNTGGRTTWEDQKPLLETDSTVTVTLEQSRDADGEPQTEIVIAHDGLPVEWIDDMAAWWGLQLAIVDHARFGVPKT